MSGKKKTEDKLIESIRKNKDASKNEPCRGVEVKDREEINETSKNKKTGKTSVKSTKKETVFIRSKRVWPD